MDERRTVEPSRETDEMLKNRYHLATLALILLANGCADSSATLDAGRKSSERPPNNGSFAQSTGRERTVVTLTDAAVAKFKEVLANEPTKFIRLAILNDGPTGFKYDLKVDDAIRDADFVDDSAGVTIVVDARSSVFVEGATIDWRTDPDGRSGFTFDNPNALPK